MQPPTHHSIPLELLTVFITYLFIHLLIIWFLLQECKTHKGVDCVLSLYPKCLEESVAHNRCSLDICWIKELL